MRRRSWQNLTVVCERKKQAKEYKSEQKLERYRFTELEGYKCKRHPISLMKSFLYLQKNRTLYMNRDQQKQINLSIKSNIVLVNLPAHSALLIDKPCFLFDKFWIPAVIDFKGLFKNWITVKARLSEI